MDGPLFCSLVNDRFRNIQPVQRGAFLRITPGQTNIFGDLFYPGFEPLVLQVL